MHELVKIAESQGAYWRTPEIGDRTSRVSGGLNNSNFWTVDYSMVVDNMFVAFLTDNKEKADYKLKGPRSCTKILR